jgi:hypothetical protein
MGVIHYQSKEKIAIDLVVFTKAYLTEISVIAIRCHSLG